MYLDFYKDKMVTQKFVDFNLPKEKYFGFSCDTADPIIIDSPDDFFEQNLSILMKSVCEYELIYIKEYMFFEPCLIFTPPNRISVRVDMISKETYNKLMEVN